MFDFYDNKYFFKLLNKTQKNGLKYKNYLKFYYSFKLFFLLKKKYNYKLVDSSYISSINYDLQLNLPIFTKKKKKKKLINKSLSIKKKFKELLKWITLLLNLYKFRNYIFRLAMFLIDISISINYNALYRIKINILKSIRRGRKKKHLKKKKLYYLGEIKNIKC